MTKHVLLVGLFRIYKTYSVDVGIKINADKGRRRKRQGIDYVYSVEGLARGVQCIGVMAMEGTAGQ